MGKCFVAHGENFDSPREWSEKGPFRFYFTELYDLKTNTFDEVSMKARRMGTLGKGKGKGTLTYFLNLTIMSVFNTRYMFFVRFNILQVVK